MSAATFSVRLPFLGSVASTAAELGALADLDRARQRIHMLGIHCEYLERKLEDHGVDFTDIVSHIGVGP